MLIRVSVYKPNTALVSDIFSSLLDGLCLWLQERDVLQRSLVEVKERVRAVRAGEEVLDVTLSEEQLAMRARFDVKEKQALEELDTLIVSFRSRAVFSERKMRTCVCVLFFCYWETFGRLACATCVPVYSFSVIRLPVCRLRRNRRQLC